MSAAFWNDILQTHADATLAAGRVTKPVTPARTYRGWEISWDYGHYSATSPNYDASWEGEEDGWVDNSQRVSARTIEGLRAEVDAWFEENGL